MTRLPVGGWLWVNLSAAGLAEMSRQCWGIWLLATALKHVGPYDPRTWQAAERKRARRAARNRAIAGFPRGLGGWIPKMDPVPCDAHFGIDRSYFLPKPSRHKLRGFKRKQRQFNKWIEE